MRVDILWPRSSSRANASTSEAPRPLSRTERVLFVTLSVSGATFALALGLFYAKHIWLWQPDGHPVPNDFVAFWSAGHLALHVSSQAPYDRHLQHATEVHVVGREFPDYLQWAYPPLFLLVAVLLASTSVTQGFLGWMAANLIFQGMAVSSIVRSRASFFVSWAAPWTMLGVIHGQNQGVTAAIVGAVLLSLERRPALSGVLLGLLSYKPQLALLFPLALAFGGYWRAFGWACVSTVAWTVLSCLAFGVSTFLAFIRGISSGTEGYVRANGIPWDQLQSLLGFTHRLGAPLAVCTLLQYCLMAGCAVIVVGLWRARLPFALKAAGLATAIPLATPYVFIYDYTLLCVALAFLYRQRSFDWLEYMALGAAFFTTMLYVWTAVPAGLISAGLVGAIVWRRTLESLSSPPRQHTRLQSYMPLAPESPDTRG